MNKYLIILIIIALTSILALVIFISLSILNKYKDKIVIAEEDIENDLNRKLEIISLINNEIKKNIKGRNYLEDYLKLNNNITNIERDIKLNEAEDFLNKLLSDNAKLNTAKVKKQLAELRNIDERITSFKNLYNKNAVLNNNFIKKFPNNIISKLFGYKVKSYYVNNKTDDLDNF